MQDRDKSYLDRRERIRRSDKSIMRHKQNIVTRIPNHTSGERDLANSPHPDVYRQAMKVILETPEMEKRLSYITAGTIVTILGSWLMGSMFKNRAFAMFTYIMVFLGSMALAGLLIGIVLGAGFISTDIMLVLLLGLVLVSIWVLVILLGGLLLRSTQRSQ
ncbi:MAG: hypothetical protein HZB51_15520 [Chloroflexi bacterium]|nr:hypothetical protein [Chloroflexota bacterium]